MFHHRQRVYNKNVIYLSFIGSSSGLRVQLQGGILLQHLHRCGVESRCGSDRVQTVMEHRFTRLDSFLIFVCVSADCVVCVVIALCVCVCVCRQQQTSVPLLEQQRPLPPNRRPEPTIQLRHHHPGRVRQLGGAGSLSVPAHRYGTESWEAS